MAEHAKLSASGAYRWLACPPSAQLETQFPDSSSDYAKEGSFAHALAEIELRKALGENIRRPAGYRDSEFYSEAMEDHLQAYVSQVLERIAVHRASTPDLIIMFEQRLDFSRWVPDGFGTGDVVIVSDMGVEVIDLKYGQGVPVSAVGNPQLRLYGLGAYDCYRSLYDLLTVTMTIIQPRLDSISTETLEAIELIEWAETVVKPRAELAIAGKGEFCAGEHCRFCRAKATCRARAEANLALAQYEFMAPALLTNDEIADILKRAEELDRWVSDILSYALDQAENHGVKFPGYKLVEGRSVRKYADEGAVASTLSENGYTEEQIYEKVLLGITKMEKLLGKKRFAELLDSLVIKPAGKPCLVPESDKRPEINSTAAAQADFTKESA